MLSSRLLRDALLVALTALLVSGVTSRRRSPEWLPHSLVTTSASAGLQSAVLQTINADGGLGTTTVIVDGCAWSAVSTVGWVTIEAGQSGTGGGLVQFAVSPNPGGARVGVVRIGGTDLIVRQASR